MTPNIERGRRVKAARIRKGYNRQTDLARKTGISQQSISRIERGHNVRIDIFLPLMQTLDITLDYLIGSGKCGPDAEPC